MPDTQLLKKFEHFALELKDEARRIIGEELLDGIDIQTKQDESFVTSIDVKIEKCFRSIIRDHYPEHGIIGEEFGEDKPDAEYIWTIDPIDGTEELVNGVPLYGTILALLHNSKPVLGLIDHSALDVCLVGGKGTGVRCNGKPVIKLGEPSISPRLYIGSRHQFLRGKDDSEIFDKASEHFPNVRVFCTCYAFTGLVLGQADVALEYNLKIWDLAAVEILIEEVGGKFIKFGEQQLDDGLKLYGAVFGKQETTDNLFQAIALKPAG
jgi:myo-inositol-1(or 4)-monophosphatase